jgi:glycosyltransferase involved in cell wall biosynthesis
VKILHVVTLITPTGAYGGPVRVALNQAAEMTGRGHDVLVAAAAQGFTELPTQIEGIECRLFPAARLVPGTGFAGLSSPTLLRWLAGHASDFDVVHVHAARDLVTLPALLVAARVRPVFAQTHGMIDASSHPLARAFDGPLTRRALGRAGRIFHLTELEFADLVQVGVAADRLVYLPNGVPPATPTRSARRKDVLFLARLHPRKNALTFVQSATRLATLFPEWTFSLVGPDEGDGQRVREAITVAGLDKQITYEGAIPPDETTDRMHAASVLALPSRDEPFPMSVLEGLAAGLPAVVTDTCGVAPALQQAGAGLVTDGTEAGLTEALRTLMASPDTLATMSARAIEVAATTYSMSRVGDVLEQTYNGTPSSTRRVRTPIQQRTTEAIKSAWRNATGTR